MSATRPTRALGAGCTRKLGGSAGWNETTVGSAPRSATASVTSKTKRRAPSVAPESAIVPTAAPPLPSSTRTSQTLPAMPAPCASSTHRYTREVSASGRPAPSPSRSPGHSDTRRGSGPSSTPAPPAICPRQPPHSTGPRSAPARTTDPAGAGAGGPAEGESGVAGAPARPQGRVGLPGAAAGGGGGGAGGGGWGGWAGPPPPPGGGRRGGGGGGGRGRGRWPQPSGGGCAPPPPRPRQISQRRSTFARCNGKAGSRAASGP